MMLRRGRDAMFTIVTLGAFALLVAALFVVLAPLVIGGGRAVAHVVFGSTNADTRRAIYGTVLSTLLMTIAVMPVGVAAAIHLTEYARPTSRLVGLVRVAVRTLATVPSIVFGLFGLGFFVLFVGRGVDRLAYPDASSSVFGRPGVLWAALTLAVLTLPVVIVTTQEALRAVPRELREAGEALGATKLQTIVRLVLPSARSGILTGAILAVSRGAGEVAAVLFTGVAAYVPKGPTDLREGFQSLGYHVYVLATQAPPGDEADTTMFACALVFVVVTCSLNALALVLRGRARRSR